MTDGYEIYKLAEMLEEAGFEGDRKPLSIITDYRNGDRHLWITDDGVEPYLTIIIDGRYKVTTGAKAENVFRLFAQLPVSDTELLTFGPEPTRGLSPAVTSLKTGGGLSWVCTDPEAVGIAEDIRAGVLPASVLMDWIDDHPHAGTTYPDVTAKARKRVSLAKV